MSNIILHLGLPKTATTLLQSHVFNLAPELIDYAGIKQPRNSKQDPLFTVIVECISNDEVAFQMQKMEVIELLKQRLLQLKGRKLLISEECFSLDSGSKCTWQDKYRRLGEIFSTLNSVHILITTREPVSASYSYYVELYQSVKDKYTTPVHFATKSNLCKIYDYQYLDKIIKQSFTGAKVSYVDFSRLKNKTFVEEITSTLNLPISHHLELPNTNSKLKTYGGVQTHSKSVFSYFDQLFIIRLMRKSSLLKKTFKKAANWLRDSQVPGSKIVVPNLSQQQKKVLSEYFADSRIFLSSLTFLYIMKSKTQKNGD